MIKKALILVMYVSVATASSAIIREITKEDFNQDDQLQTSLHNIHRKAFCTVYKQHWSSELEQIITTRYKKK